MTDQNPIVIRRMKPAELGRISELDRSEHITTAYELRDGELTRIEVNWDVPGWFREGEGEHSLAEQIAFCQSHLDRGGVLLGAFQDDHLVGAAVVQPQIREDLAQMAFLHVSLNNRRQGIALVLMEESKDVAREAGARRMYVSSVPSESAVGFYLAQGCRLAEEVDPDLYALEPEDIHLILDL